MGFRIVVLYFLVIFFGAVFVPAAQHRTPVVLILLRSSTGTETRSFRVLIVDAITVEMASRDIDAVSTSFYFLNGERDPYDGERSPIDMI